MTTPPAPLSVALAERDGARAELAEFLYAVSHDLRAPLRHILAYADVIREDHPGLPAPVQAHLGVMTQAARKLQAQIDGLTALSRLSTRTPQCQAVLLIDSLARALNALAWPIHGQVLGHGDTQDRPAPTGAQAHLGHTVPVAPDDRPTGGAADAAVWADPAWLDEVWAELLSNALKATAAHPTPTLHLSWQRVGANWQVSLSDNGLGWDATQAPLLFKPFAKLHPSAQFDGLGLGLVRVRKTLRALGGNLQLSAQPGQGCCATVSLLVASTAHRIEPATAID